MATKIETAVSLAQEAALAATEQGNGSRQVLETLRGIESGTANIRDGAVEMNGGTETILKEISRLSNVSQEVQERSASISKAAGTIKGALEEIVKGAASNSEAIDALAGITGRFRL